MKLLFNRDAIPRTTTRDQWKKIDRWRRNTQNYLSRAEDLMHQHVIDLLIFGRTDLTAEKIDRMINPPVVVFP